MTNTGLVFDLPNMNFEIELEVQSSRTFSGAKGLPSTKVCNKLFLAIFD
jgi:hypothetical protein